MVRLLPLVLVACFAGLARLRVGSGLVRVPVAGLGLAGVRLRPLPVRSPGIAVGFLRGIAVGFLRVGLGTISRIFVAGRALVLWLFPGLGIRISSLAFAFFPRFARGFGFAVLLVLLLGGSSVGWVLPILLLVHLTGIALAILGSARRVLGIVLRAGLVWGVRRVVVLGASLTVAGRLRFLGVGIGQFAVVAFFFFCLGWRSAAGRFRPGGVGSAGFGRRFLSSGRLGVAGLFRVLGSRGRLRLLTRAFLARRLFASRGGLAVPGIRFGAGGTLILAGLSVAGLAVAATLRRFALGLAGSPRLGLTVALVRVRLFAGFAQSGALRLTIRRLVVAALGPALAVVSGLGALARLAL